MLRLEEGTDGDRFNLIASLVKHGFLKTIVTTNYDTLIEDACQTVGAELEVVVNEYPVTVRG